MCSLALAHGIALRADYVDAMTPVWQDVFSYGLDVVASDPSGKFQRTKALILVQLMDVCLHCTSQTGRLGPRLFVSYWSAWTATRALCVLLSVNENLRGRWSFLRLRHQSR